MTFRWNSFATLALLFAIVCAPLVLSTRDTNYATDERNWHLPAVRQIRAHWPALDLRGDSLSATAPGYHYFLATTSLVTGTSRVALRATTWAVSLILLFLLWRLFPAERGTLAMVALLPLALSNFFVKSASWIVTDNPGLLGASVVLIALLFGRGQRAAWSAGIAAVAATFVRQLHVWTSASTALIAWRTWSERGRRLPELAIFIPVFLPILLLALLFWSWNGLVPPAWQTYQVSAGLAVGAGASFCYILAVVFLFGVWFWLAIGDENLVSALRAGPSLFGGTTGLLLALITPTNFAPSAGRWGGYLWNLAEYLPVVAHRSVVFIVLTPLGGALLVAFASQIARKIGRFEALAWLGSYAAWAATFLPNRFAYQRYFEPMTLVFLILWALLLLRKSPQSHWRTGWLWTLGAGQGALTLLTAHYQTWIAPVAMNR